MHFFRSYPEWSKIDSDLKSVTRYSERKNNMFISGETGLSEFARKQPQTISEVLFQIDDRLKQTRAAEKEIMEAIPQLRSDLQSLPEMFENIKLLRKNHQASAAKLTKSNKVYEQANQKFLLAQGQGPNSPEMITAQVAFDSAQRQKDEDQQEFDTLDAQLKETEIEYKKNVFNTFATAFINYADRKTRDDNLMISHADAIINFGNHIPEYDDLSIYQIQTMIQALKLESRE